TWAQLGRHKKPILIVNIDRFWDPLCALIEHMERLDFIRNNMSVNLLVAERVEEVLPKLSAAAHAVSEAEKEMTRVTAGRIGASRLRLQDRHRLDAVAVGIADEGGVVALAVLRPQSRRAVGCTARGQRGGVEGVDQFARAHPQRDMAARIAGERRHAGAQ